jgi:transcriptional regulator with XRE-family HTH domain
MSRVPPESQDRQKLARELARLPRDVTTAITWRMKDQHVNKAWLAREMGVSPGRVSQILSGDENLTLRTLAAVCVALDAHLEVKLVPNSEDSRREDTGYLPGLPRPASVMPYGPGSPWPEATAVSGLPGR